MRDDFERFRTAWQGHAESSPAEDPTAAWPAKVRRLDRDRLRGEVREIAVAASAVGVFVGSALWLPQLWLQGWAFLLAGASAWVAFRKFRSAFGQKRATDESLLVFCRSELARLESEIRLQRTLVWWYLLPILVGTSAYVWTFSRDPIAESLVMLPISLGVVGLIAVWTRRSLRGELLPKRDELAHCLAELESSPGA